MSQIIMNESNKPWNGMGFGGDAKPLGTMDELNREISNIKASGYRGIVHVVPSGGSVNEALAGMTEIRI